MIVKLHRLGKLLLCKRIRIANGGIEFLHKRSIGRERGRSGWTWICRLHPRGEMVFKNLIDEQADVDFDVVPCLEDVNLVIHVKVALTFHRNLKFVVD